MSCCRSSVSTSRCEQAFDTQSDLEKGIALSLADSKQDIDKELEQAKLLSLLEESKVQSAGRA